MTQILFNLSEVICYSYVNTRELGERRRDEDVHALYIASSL